MGAKRAEARWVGNCFPRGVLTSRLLWPKHRDFGRSEKGVNVQINQGRFSAEIEYEIVNLTYERVVCECLDALPWCTQVWHELCLWDYHLLRRAQSEDRRRTDCLSRRAKKGRENDKLWLHLCSDTFLHLLPLAKTPVPTAPPHQPRKVTTKRNPNCRKIANSSQLSFMCQDYRTQMGEIAW